MTSSADLVSRSLRRIGVIGAGETPSADDAADGLSAMNAMIAGWQADGFDVSAEVPLPARHEEGIIALLAVRLAPDFGMVASDQVQLEAKRGMDRLQAEYLRVPTSQFDYGLTASNTQNGAVTCSPPAIWKQKTDYAVGDTVQWAGRVYECTAAGTSGAGAGPMGFATTITDGTVVWTYKRVI